MFFLIDTIKKCGLRYIQNLKNHIKNIKMQKKNSLYFILLKNTKLKAKYVKNAIIK